MEQKDFIHVGTQAGATDEATGGENEAISRQTVTDYNRIRRTRSCFSCGAPATKCRCRTEDR
jgi:hypothetical protein